MNPTQPPQRRRGSYDSVLDALRRRFRVQHVDWIAKYGLTAVTRALEEFASSFENDTLEEIGTSDVSCWLKDIEKSLDDRAKKQNTQRVAITMNEISQKTLIEQEREVLDLIDELHFAWHGNTLVTCNADGTIPLNSRIVADIDLAKLDEKWQRVIRALIATAPEMARALAPLRSEIEAARFEGRITPNINDSANMLSAYLLAAGKALESFTRSCQPENPPCTSK